MNDYNRNPKDTDIYPDAELNISRETASVFQLKRKWEKESSMLVLDPEFQREYVWSSKKQSELIESLLMGIPLPALYMKEDENGVYVVVDGRQRLTTLFNYINGKFRLDRLNILKSYKGKSFADLSGLEQNKIEDYTMQVNVIKPPTSDRVIYDLFDRVNRGGLQLNNQEMRNALYHGTSTRFINELAKFHSFIAATEGAISPKHMKDRYLILRFIAFYLWQEHLGIDPQDGGRLEYKSNLEDFLATTMRFLNTQQSDSALLHNLELMFDETMSLASAVIVPLGGFRLPAKYGLGKRPINMAFFESFSYLLTKLQDKSPSNIERIYHSLLHNDIYVHTLTYSIDSKKQILQRYQCIREYL